MKNQKIYLYCLTGISLAIGVSLGHILSNLLFHNQIGNNTPSEAIVAVKLNVENKLSDRITIQNKGFLDDVKEGFEEVKDDAEEIGEDVRDDAVDVGEEVKDDSEEVGEEVKDDAVDVGEEVKDDAEDVREDI